MRYRWRRLVAGISLSAVACSSVELPDGKEVRVIREVIPPAGAGAYILIYRTAVTPSDCATIGKELEEVWSAVRARADQAQAPFATLIAETSGGASTVVTFSKSALGWRPTQLPWGCAAKGDALNERRP